MEYTSDRWIQFVLLNTFMFYILFTTVSAIEVVVEKSARGIIYLHCLSLRSVFNKRLFGTFVTVCVFLILATLHPESKLSHVPLFRPYQALVLNSRESISPASTISFGLDNSPVRLTDVVSMETGEGRNVTMKTASSCIPSSGYEKRIVKIKGITVYPEDFMALKPFKFLENFKNPCFIRKDNSISCFPYYLLVGAPKSGTTDLSRRIVRHQQVSSMVRKEPHWLTRKRFDINMKLKSYPTIYNYLDQYFTRAARDILQSVNGSFHPKVVGESEIQWLESDCSASTLWDNSNWPLLKENKNRSEPLNTIADFIHHLNPNAKILVILRNPIDRLYSDYLYFGRVGVTPEKFHDGVVKAIRYYNDCFRRCGYRHCLYIAKPGNIMIRLGIGLYYYSIADYMKAFPRNQILVIKMEDYSANMTHYMREVFSFLELDPLNERQMEVVTDTSTIYNKNKKAVKVGPMLSETRTLLHNFYKPHNDKLERLLGAKFWEDVESK